MTSSTIICGIITFVSVVVAISFWRKNQELESKNKFLHNETIRYKNENEKLKKMINPNYKVKEYEPKKKTQPKKQPKPEQTYEYDNTPDDRYDYVEVKSMRDMYNYNSR